ncbi:MAG: hypothetical protein AAGC81_05010 [Pseudomonadota bacterium]
MDDIKSAAIKVMDKLTGAASPSGVKNQDRQYSRVDLEKTEDLEVGDQVQDKRGTWEKVKYTARAWSPVLSALSWGP